MSRSILFETAFAKEIIRHAALMSVVARDWGYNTKPVTHACYGTTNSFWAFFFMPFVNG